MAEGTSHLWINPPLALFGRRFSYLTERIIVLLPYRSTTDWASDPDLFVAAVFHCAGFVGIVISVTGDRRPLVFWNSCYLAMLVTVTFSSPLNMAIC
jgi:hypothetical protein